MLRFRQAAGRPTTTCWKVDNPLVVPVDKKVRIITTANDVIHAWMVPAFGVKQDAIPGFVRDTWFRAEKIGDFYVASAPSSAARSTPTCPSTVEGR
jgi:cytochrome c oxidase subunit 2